MVCFIINIYTLLKFQLISRPECFPHKKRDTPSITAYTLGLLRMTAYCPVLRERILAIIVERLIQIDVCLFFLGLCHESLINGFKLG